MLDIASGHPAIDHYLAEGDEPVRGMSSRFAAAICGHVIQRQSALGIAGDLVEIGTFEGRFFIAMALGLAADEHALGIEVFDWPDAGVLDRFLANCDTHRLVRDHSPAWKADTGSISVADLRRKLARRTSRFFHIDGNHSCQSLSKDLALARAVLGPRWAGADGLECARSPPPLRSARSIGSARHPSTLLGTVLSKVEGPRRPWSQYAMVQNEVDARPRDHPSTLLRMTLSLSKGQHGQPPQQFEGIEQEVRGAIRPRVAELQDHLPLGRQTEPVLRHGRPQRVPAEPLESVPLVGRDPHAGIEGVPYLT